MLWEKPVTAWGGPRGLSGTHLKALGSSGVAEPQGPQAAVRGGTHQAVSLPEPAHSQQSSGNVGEAEFLPRRTMRLLNSVSPAPNACPPRTFECDFAGK